MTVPNTCIPSSTHRSTPGFWRAICRFFADFAKAIQGYQRPPHA